jgi:hypothetical protein
MQLARNWVAKLALGVGTAALLAFGWYWYTAPLFGDCSDQVKQELRSEDGKYVAAVIQRNCGATTDYRTVVTLRPGTAKPHLDEDQVVVDMNGPCEILLAWEKGNLGVSYPESCEVVRQTKTWSGIRIQTRHI